MNQRHSSTFNAVVSGRASYRDDVGNGSILFPLMGSKFVRVFGGPFNRRPRSMFGVKMAAENPNPADVTVASKDFGTPSEGDMVAGLRSTIRALRKGRAVYVGCAAGIGRTGLFLACLSRLLGHDHPVEYVRKHYLSHAVETEAQRTMAETMKFPFSLRAEAAMLRASGLFAFGKKNVLND